MIRYILKMKTLNGLGTEYVNVFGTVNFERYLNIHNLQYARDFSREYNITDRERINKAINFIEDKKTYW